MPLSGRGSLKKLLFGGPVLDKPDGVGVQGAMDGDVHWELETIEDNVTFKNFKVTGQFPLDDEGVTWTINNNIPEVSSFGMPHPIIQWVRGELQVVQFKVILFSRHEDEDILSRFNQMRKVTIYNKILGRPPLCLFSYGGVFSIKCLVKGMGDAKIYRLKRSGDLRRVEFSFTLVRFEPYKLNEITKNKGKLTRSRAKRVSGLDRMYEFSARREYGISNTLYGDRLRKDPKNRANPFAVPDGGIVNVPSAKVILSETIEPEFHAFLDNKLPVAEMLTDKFVARNKKYLITSR